MAAKKKSAKKKIRKTLKNILPQGEKRKLHPNSLKNIEGQQWGKGQSGNPAGRPPGSKNIKRILDKFLNYLSEDESDIDPETKKRFSIYEAIIWKQIKKAQSGELPAFKEIVDRYEGQAVIRRGLEDLSDEEAEAKLKELLGDSYKPGKSPRH